MKNDKKRIILIVVAAVVLLVVIFFVCTKVFAKNMHKNTKKGINASSSIIVNQEPDDSDLIIKIYKQENTDGTNYVITKNGHNSQEYTYLASYNCNNLNCKGYSVSPIGTKAIIFDDNKYYLYNYGNFRYEELDLGSEEFSNIELIYSDRNIYGLYITNSEFKGAFYSLDKRRFVTEFVYDANASSKSCSLVDKNYFIGVSNLDDGNTFMVYIINNESGDIVKTIDSVNDIEKELKNVSLT